MNRFQMPNIPSDQPFQILSSGYVILTDMMRYVPPNMPPNMPVDEILGFIPATVYINDWRYTVLFEGGCGCYLTTAVQDRQFARPSGRSWSSLMVCKRHRKNCKSCGVTICTSGRPDGFLFDPQDGSKPYFLCTPDFEEETKRLNRRIFWGGFLRGLFGDKK